MNNQIDIGSVSIKLRVEVGEVTLSLNDLSTLTSGSVLRLNQYAGEEVKIYANDTLIAHGDVVVVGDNYGVRIKTISETSK